MRLLLAASLGLIAVQARAQPAPAADAPDPAAAFMARTAKEPGVVVLPDGLEYKVLASGPAGGASPRIGDEVQVAYEGKLLNGTVFDSTTEESPAALTLGELVPGWDEALQMMKPGDTWMLYLPPRLGYGDEDKGPIPANSVLVFRLKLLAIGPIR